MHLARLTGPMTRCRPVAAAAIVTLGALLAACGGDGSPGERGAGGAKDSPEALWAAYTSALSKADAAAVCGLFTEEGASTFATTWGAGDCAGAVDKAAAEIEDPAGFADDHREPDTKDDNKQNFIEMTSCGVGALTGKQVDGGWQISDYRHPQSIGYCDG